jgi:LacI family transcriptional regulator
MTRQRPRDSGLHGAATIKDVARVAGVSVATVSRVVNGTGPVRDDTRQRVVEASTQLRYVPHAAARSLITRSTKTIGVLLPDLFGEFFSELIRGIDLAARSHGLHLLVSSSHSDVSDIEAMLRAMRGRVDGVIVMAPTFEVAGLEPMLPPDLPVVLVSCPPFDGPFATLRIDNYGGARQMTDYLIGLGHRRIAFVTGPEANHDAAERLRGFRDGARAAGLGAAAIECAGDFSEVAGHRATTDLLRLRERPTAIFAANDSMAIGALAALREAGLNVPQDISLAGFDDIPVSRFMTPPLTSVSIDIARLGDAAFETLYAELLGAATSPPSEQTLPVVLTLRESCAAPRDSRPMAPS